MSAGEILLEMIKNGFISLDENSKKQRAAKLIVLNKKKNGSHPLTFPIQSGREEEDLIVCKDPCVMNYCPTLSRIERRASSKKPCKGFYCEHIIRGSVSIVPLQLTEKCRDFIYREGECASISYIFTVQHSI